MSQMTPTAAALVSANVRAEMARQRVTQQALGDALTLSQAAISKRLSGAVAWDVNELSATAAFLGVPLSSLLGETAGAA